MNTKHKISIITPSYNQGHFLEETILSILTQDYDNLELLVIDGGSTDESVNIIQKYASQLTYWVSEKDSGQSNAINKGLKRATGDIITWINSDDLLLPGALKAVSDHFSRVPQTTGVIHGGTILFENGKDLRTVLNYGISSKEKYIGSMAFSQPAAFFRKSYLDQVGLLREDLHYGMDYDLFARLATVSHFQPVSTIFSKYRLHDESKSVAHSDKFRTDWNRVFLSICQHLGWESTATAVQQFLPDLNIQEELFNYSYIPDVHIVSQIDQQKVLFYFLSDLLLHYYWYDQRDTARALLRQMTARFPKKWFTEEQRVQDVVFKLKLPDILLRSMKGVKQIFKKG